MLAKIASDANKPDGQCNVGHTTREVVRFMICLCASSWRRQGHGAHSERATRCTYMWRAFRCSKQRVTPGLFKQHTRDWLLKCSLGIASPVREDPGGARVVDPKEREISKESTFRGVSESNELVKICRNIATGLAEDMAKEELRARTVTLKVKTVTLRS